MSERLEEIKEDIAELQNFLQQATRQKVKDILSVDLRKLESDKIALEQQSAATFSGPQFSQSVSQVFKRYQVKLNNYAWNESSDFVEFYVTLPKVQHLPRENIRCKFTDRSLELSVEDLENKDYTLVINNLLHSIDPEKSNWKTKTDMVLIKAAKKDKQTWNCVTSIEKKVKDANKFDTDEKMDGEDGIMSIMRNMYQRGDDEMKRTIAKAWTESQTKGTNLNL